MAEFAALPLFTDALLSDTGHLTDAEFGLYMRLLVLLWRSPECRIPNDKAWIAKRLRRSPLEYASEIAPLIAEFCTVDGNYVFQKRLLKEFEYTREKKIKGKNAAQARWGNENARKEPSEDPIENKGNLGDENKTPTKRGKTPQNADVPSVPDKSLENNELPLCLGDAPTPTPTPSLFKNRERGATSSAVTKTDETEIWFQEKFWNIYPKERAGSKDSAKKAMTKALTKTTKEEIENAVIRYAQSDEVARGYAKGAAAWLNDERWTSQYRPAQGKGGPRSHKKASYLDKVANAGDNALRQVKARLELDNNAPWGKHDQPDAGANLGRVTGETRLIENGTRKEVSEFRGSPGKEEP